MALPIMTLLSFLPDSSTALLIGITTFLIVYVILQQRMSKRNGVPPGPAPLPFVGNLVTILSSLLRAEHPHDMVTRLSKAYGKIFSLSFGTGVRVVYLNDLKSVTEAFQNPALSDRIPNGAVERLTGASGIFINSGDVWRHQRRFSLSVFRSFGVGKQSFEERIATEARFLGDEFETFDQRPFDPKHFFMCAASNIICSVIFGRRFAYNDAEFKRMLALLDKRMNIIGAGGLTTLIPVMRYFFFRSARKNDEIVMELLTYFSSIVEKHKLDDGGSLEADAVNDCNDLIDLYLRAINKNDKEPYPSDFIDEAHLVALIEGLFLAGSDTTSLTLAWTFLILADKPQVQERIHDEIRSVCGNNLPSFSDQPRMPYAHAAIMESMRLFNITTLGVPHFAGQDTTIQNHCVPKGSIVIANQWGIMHDPDVWTDPYEFRPERFLNEDGAVAIPDTWIPFSTGRRICLGERLARMELFIFVTHLVSRFSFLKPADGHTYDFRGRSGATLSPMPYEFRAIPRHNTEY